MSSSFRTFFVATTREQKELQRVDVHLMGPSVVHIGAVTEPYARPKELTGDGGSCPLALN